MAHIDETLLRDGAAYAGQWVAAQRARHDTPGVVLLIAHDDTVVLSEGYGYANLEQGVPMTPDRIFRIASHSKTFTATAIMQLVERDALRLDDRLSTYIPWLQEHDALTPITVRQALNHSAGLIRDGNEADYWRLDGAFPDVEGLRRLVADGGAVLPPNERFKYSNIGYALLGLVIERVAGVPYNTFVTTQIIEPLGLSDTGPETDDRARRRLATGYTVRQLGLPRRPLADANTRAFSPATGFYATASDLGRYAAAQVFGNAALLSDAAKREMQQPYWTPEQADDRYGLGFIIVDIGERRMVGHSGGFPGHATRTMVDPRDGLIVVVLTNESGGPANAFARTVTAIIDFAVRQPQRAEPERYAPFCGRFVNAGGAIDIAAFGETLLALSPESDDPIKVATQLAVEDDDTLRITKTSGYGSPGETVRYRRDAAGQIQKIVAGGVSFYPLEVYRTALEGN